MSRYTTFYSRMDKDNSCNKQFKYNDEKALGDQSVGSAVSSTNYAVGNNNSSDTKATSPPSPCPGVFNIQNLTIL